MPHNRVVFLAAIALAMLSMGLAGWPQPAEARGRYLSAAELKRLHGVFHAIWKNKHKARVLVRRDGTLLARSGPRVDTGRWEVRGNELCVAFKVWTRGRYKCGRVEKVGKWYVGLRRDDGTPRLKMRR